MKRVLIFGLLLLLAASAAAQEILDSLYAPSLGRTMKCVLLLPETEGKVLPVLYLLHGLYGNQSDWTARTGLVRYSRGLPLVIVMPDAENSWYTNAWNDSSARFEDYIVKDLPRLLSAKYPIDTTRQAIAGLSMGGYGALKIALKYPGKYFFAAGLSSAITVPSDLKEREKESPTGVMVESIRKAFAGAPDSFLMENDVLCLAQESAGELPYFFLAHGVQDRPETFLREHRELAEIFRRRGIAYEYHELQGKHNWTFWDREIQPVLRRVQELLADSTSLRGR
jgi:putative tributyrin esterase